jgi:hypothetical protein
VTGEIIASTNREPTGIESLPTDDSDIEVIELSSDSEVEQPPAPSKKLKKPQSFSKSRDSKKSKR